MNQTTPEQPQLPESETQLLKLADQCVMCGICLPHCPTYIKTLNEGESPRGRISLIQGLLRGGLEHSEQLQHHLDSCLTCRACEPACPSGVAFGKLMDGSRHLLREQGHGKNWAKEKLLETTASPKKLRLSGKLLRLAQSTGTLKLLQLGAEKLILENSGWRELLPEKIPEHHRWQPHYPSVTPSKGKVALFTGCIADITDQQTLRDAITLLNHCGYEVAVPGKQGCCGALHHHAGDKEHTDLLLKNNLEAFASDQYQAIIFCATGCGTHLKEYGELSQGESSAQQFANKSMEIGQFLLQHGLDQLSFQPLGKRVAVHIPCTQRNVLKQSEVPFQLLKQIPELAAIPMPDNHRCCGSAGSYMLEQPEMARQLRNDKLLALKETGAEILVSSNIGCALHLNAGLRQQEQHIEVIHPISLLARQLIP
jgi:glycolate oxidase iron-sulfur subunit